MKIKIIVALFICIILFTYLMVLVFSNDFVLSAIPGWHTVIIPNELILKFLIISFIITITVTYMHNIKKKNIKILLPYLLLSLPLPIISMILLISSVYSISILFISIYLFITGQIYISIVSGLSKISAVSR